MSLMQTQPTVKIPTRRLPRWLLALIVAAAATASVAQERRIDLPDMGNSADNYLSDSEKREYAEAILMQMRAYNILVDDPLIAGYFSDMGFRLVAMSDEPTKPFTFVVLDENRVNAFAAPGGVVALHSGLILEAETESEVAGVLAHEIAHITQLHLYRTLQNAQNLTIPIALGMLALILAGGGGGEAIAGAVATGTGLQQQAYINFTRANESEADRIGIRTLAMAGYDPEGMADFFERLNRVNRTGGEQPPEFLRTHPVTVNRIAEAKDRAATMQQPERGNDFGFYLAQARLRAMFEPRPADAEAWFRNRLEFTHDEIRADALRYGLAIALQKRREFDEARELLDELLKRHPGRLPFELQMAALDADTGDDAAATERLASLWALFPGNHAIAMQYGKILVHQDNPESAALATEVLRRQLRDKTDDPALYELYARAAAQAGESVRASEALAESYFLRGGVKEALQQLEMLKRRDDLNYYQRARVTARLEEMRIILADFDVSTPDDA
ncbi:M48 family metallopeptidase [Marinihelvus fidelis]|uniref:Putative beta-barrel assembly-enhancing protease n=1 Tax=Marinihelvus fidelis TaxID=2613842 RepID=A0A5N0T4L2_9GAMM|nr:M48 family metalloprotease [Marinihelvus fidelis]KAA9129843.1 M48 family metallopeptidase [Marinihelvus fidelis]